MVKRSKHENLRNMFENNLNTLKLDLYKIELAKVRVQ
jgi:hypothetical protein